MSPYEIVYGDHSRLQWGGRYICRSRSEGKVLCTTSSQTLAVISDLTCIRDLFPTGLLHSFEPGDKVLLKTWRTGSPESHLEEKPTGRWDVLLMVKLKE